MNTGANKGSGSGSGSEFRSAFTDDRRYDYNEDGDNQNDFVFYGFENGNGKPGHIAGRAPLYDLNIPGKILALIDDPRPKRSKPPTKRALIEYIGSSLKIDVDAIYRRWKKVERGVWVLIMCVAIWITTIVCAALWPNRSAALLKEMVTTPSRDMLDDRLVERAVQVIKEDTGEEVKPLD